MPLARYLELNSRFGAPFVFGLTKRGFFSEVNNLLNAVLFGLLNKRRLVVDQRDFASGQWELHFDAHLPGPNQEDLCGEDWHAEPRRRPRTFDSIRDEIGSLWKARAFVSVSELEIAGDIFTAKRRLASLFCVPRRDGPETANSVGLDGGAYATCHVRRGDKTEGYLFRGKEIIEGEIVPVSEYVAEIRRRAPGTRRIFLMTDDGSVVEEFRRYGDEFSVHTFCAPNSKGYFHREFAAMQTVDRNRAIARLLNEVRIAAGSGCFVGAYRSNVSRFVLLVHHDPAVCSSVDRQKVWHPR